MDLNAVIALPWVVPVICFSTVGIVAIVTGMVSDCVKRVAETNLKQSMVENGYSAEQIQYVLAAHPDGKPPRKAAMPPKKAVA